MKILALLSTNEYVRNYGQTGAFQPLWQEHDFRLLLSDQCHQAELLRDLPGYSGTFKTDKKLNRAHYELFNVLTWRNRRRSRTFHYRFSRLYREYPNDSLRHLWLNLAGLRRAAKYVLLGNRWTSKRTIPRLIDQLPINPQLERALRELAPDLVVFPCSAHDPVGNDLARLARRMGFKTLFLVDNWDNLSSKSIFWAMPDYVGVWGEQSRQHAIEIHGFAREQVFILGTPRFEGYYAIDKASGQGRPYAFPYILFCGSSLAFDELDALHRLERELNAHPELYGPELKIVYRPHPERQPRSCPDVFRETDFTRVVLDAQIKDKYQKRGFEFPALDYYPGLLAGARLVVGPLTTMLLEAVLCGTPVLALSYDDGIHYTSPHNARKYYLHFEGIEAITGLSLVRDREHLDERLRACYAGPAQLDRDAVNISLEYFLHHDPLSYPERLRAAVQAVARAMQDAGASRLSDSR